MKIYRKITLLVFLLTPQFLYAQTASLVEVATNGDHEVVDQLLSQEDIDINERDVTSGNTALIGASSNGHLEVVELLLNDPEINVNIQNIDGRNALMMAIINGHNDVVSALTQRDDIDINATDTLFGNTALHYSVVNSNGQATKIILDYSDVDVNIQNNSDLTPLIIAASDKDSSEILEMLIKVPNIDFELRNDSSYNAFMSACLNGNFDSVQLLLPFFDLNAVDRRGNTALMLVSSLGNIGIADVLLQYINIDVTSKNEDGDTALGLAKYSKIISAIIEHRNFDLSNIDFQVDSFVSIMQNDNLLALERLVSHPDLNFNESALNIAFALSLKHDNEGMFEILLNYKGDEILKNISHEKVEELIAVSRNPNGKLEPLLEWAITEDRKELLEVLFILDRSLMESALGANNATPLIWASAGGHINVVEYLVSMLPISEINAQDDTGSSALIATIINDKPEVVDFLLDIREVDVSVKDKIGYTALAWASLTNKYAVVSRLLRSYRDRFEASDIFTALMLAAEEGHASVVREILQNSRHVELLSEYMDTMGMTPLMVAAENNHSSILSNLINFGYDINHQDNLGNTALHLAVSNGSNEAVGSLLSFRNIDVNIQDYTTGATPLILSLEQNNRNAALSILNHPDVDVDIKNSEGVHPIMFTSDFDDEEIISLILQKSKN